MSKDMVTAGTIFNLAKRALPKSVSLDNTLTFAVDCYESGMIEVLRGIAYSDFKIQGPILSSKHTKKISRECQRKFEMLRNVLNENEVDLLEEYNESFIGLMGAEGADCYIEGFISGYRYLKSQIEFGPNLKEEYDADVNR